MIPGSGAGQIQLGMSRDSARSLLSKMGYPVVTTQGDSDYFCENALQLEYDSGFVRFIGISEHPRIACTFKDKDVFDLSAADLFAIVAEGEPAIPLVQPGGTCFFPRQGINLWEADEQYDRKGNYKRKVYAQVGVENPEAP